MRMQVLGAAFSIVVCGGGCGVDPTGGQPDQSQAVRYFFEEFGSSDGDYMLSPEYESPEADARQLRSLYASCKSDSCNVGAWSNDDDYTLRVLELFCREPVANGGGRLIVLFNNYATADVDLPACVPMEGHAVVSR